MRGIIRTSISFRFLMLILAGIITFVSINQMRSMPVDVLPEYSLPFVEIQTEALGLSAEEVEQMLTVPMEQDLLAGVAWLDIIRSESVPGLSSVLIYFEPGTDLYRARQMVAERLAQSAVGLPHVSKPPTMIQPASSTSRFMIVGLSSKKLSLIEMSVLARWTIAPRLMGVPGVSNVAIWGQRERQLQVLVNPEKLRAQEVSLDQVIETTGNALWVSSLSFLEASSPGTGGFIDTPNQRLGVWHLLPISSPADLAKVPIEGSPELLLDDVADVVEDHQLLIGDAVINNGPNLLLVVEKLPGTNTLEVTRGLESALDALRPGFKDIDFNANLFRPASFIEQSIANLTQTLVFAVILLILMLGAFLYGWRTAIISLLVLPVSLLAVFGVLYLRGETLNAMVLAGMVMALGIVIDEIVIDIDSLTRRLRQNRQDGTPMTTEAVILEALSESRGSIFFGILVTLLAIMPVFFVEGTSGALLRPLVVTYSLAVLAAMFTALLVTPALCLILLSNTSREERISPLVGWLQRTYDKLLGNTVQKTGLAFAMVIIFIAIGLVVAPFISRDKLVPTFHEPYITIGVNGAPATSRGEMDRMVARISAELQTIPGVQNVGAHVGRAVFGDQVVGINSAELLVNINPTANYKATMAAIHETMAGYIGLEHSIRTYIDQTLSEPRSAPANTITLRVFGDDLDVLGTQAENLRQSLAGISGISASRVDHPITEPTVEIEVDLATAQKYGIKPGEVRRAAATMLSGLPVGSLFEEQKVFDVVVWSPPELRDSLSDIQMMPIETKTGGYIHLNDVANVHVVESPTVIRREGVSAYLDIILTLQGRDNLSVARDVEASIKSFAFPLEYHAEVLTDYAKQQADMQRMIVAVTIALVGILLLLQAASGNWRLSIVTFLMLPASLAGGLLMAYLTGANLSVTALLGLVGVFGLAARNSIMLIRHYERIERSGGPGVSAALVQQGTREQIVPIMMTTLLTAGALLPFALAGDMPGLEVFRPMAFIMLGGLVTSAAFNLLAVPAFYLKFGAGREADLGFVPEVQGGLPVAADD